MLRALKLLLPLMMAQLLLSGFLAMRVVDLQSAVATSQILLQPVTDEALPANVNDSPRMTTTGGYPVSQTDHSTAIREVIEAELASVIGTIDAHMDYRLADMTHELSASLTRAHHPHGLHQASIDPLEIERRRERVSERIADHIHNGRMSEHEMASLHTELAGLDDEHRRLMFAELYRAINQGELIASL